MSEIPAGLQPVSAQEIRMGDGDAAADFTEAWLRNRRFSANTREAYRRDVSQWLTWCALHRLDPLTVKFLHVNQWARDMEEPGDDRRPYSPATVARKMAAVSSWYAFLVKLEQMPANPAAVADRPMVDPDFSPTVSFSREDAAAMLRRAAEHGDPHLGVSAAVLATWMVTMGTRATETVEVTVGDLGHHDGHRTVQLRLKGGRQQTRAIPPPLAVMVDDYLTRRGAAPGERLFLGAGGQELTRHDLARFVRRLAVGAGVRDGHRISPHSFRHAWNSTARREGAMLEDRQRAMGHRDPRTTRRYDQRGNALIHDPALLVAAAVARDTDD